MLDDAVARPYREGAIDGESVRQAVKNCMPGAPLEIWTVEEIWKHLREPGPTTRPGLKAQRPKNYRRRRKLKRKRAARSRCINRG